MMDGRGAINNRVLKIQNKPLAQKPADNGLSCRGGCEFEKVKIVEQRRPAHIQFRKRREGITTELFFLHRVNMINLLSPHGQVVPRNDVRDHGESLQRHLFDLAGQFISQTTWSTTP